MTAERGGNHLRPRENRRVFSPRQLEVISLVVEGLNNNSQIGKRLGGISHKTIEQHKQNAAQRMEDFGQRRSFRRAVALAVLFGLVGTNGLSAEGVETLTRREKEIAGLVFEGFSATDVCGALWISSHTYDAHLNHIRKKLSVSTVYQVVAVIALAKRIEMNSSGNVVKPLET